MELYNEIIKMLVLETNKETSRRAFDMNIDAKDTVLWLKERVADIRTIEEKLKNWL